MPAHLQARINNLIVIIWLTFWLTLQLSCSCVLSMVQMPIFGRMRHLSECRAMACHSVPGRVLKIQSYSFILAGKKCPDEGLRSLRSTS